MDSHRHEEIEDTDSEDGDSDAGVDAAQPTNGSDIVPLSQTVGLLTENYDLYRSCFVCRYRYSERYV